MFRIKDFYLKKIYNLKGKKLGIVKDIILDFSNGRIIGLEVNNYSFLGNKNFLDIKDIVTMEENIICKEIKEKTGLKFLDIKDLEVVDKNGNIKGEIEDLIIDEKEFKIKGIVLNSGLIDKIVKGREIILINQCVLGDDFLLYLGSCGISVKNIPSLINKDVYYKKA